MTTANLILAERLTTLANGILRTAIIKQVGSKWVLYTKKRYKDKKTGKMKRRRLGTHPSHAAAERQERAVMRSKHGTYYSEEYETPSDMHHLPADTFEKVKALHKHYPVHVAPEFKKKSLQQFYDWLKDHYINAEGVANTLNAFMKAVDNEYNEVVLGKKSKHSSADRVFKLAAKLADKYHYDHTSYFSSFDKIQWIKQRLAKVGIKLAAVDIDDFKVVDVKKKDGYELHTRRYKGDSLGYPKGSNKKLDLVVALTPDGKYIGEEKWAKKLITEMGIKPELKDPSSNVCSIGFCKTEGKWYGWSHRAIWGFKIGDVIKEGDSCTTPGVTAEYLKDHPEMDRSVPVGFECKTLKDCKRCAIAFADSVS